jgi:uncharacterized membrane protein YesL
MRARTIRRNWLDEAEHWSIPIIANLLWVLLSVFIVTIPLGLVGLFGVIYRWMDDRNPQVMPVFLGTIRRVWYKAYLVMGLNLLAGGLVVLNLLIFQMMDADLFTFLARSITLFVGLLLVMVNLYVWPLLAVWDVPLKRVLKTSAQLVLIEPIWAGVFAVGFGLSVVASVFLPPAAFVIFWGALFAYGVSRGLRFILRRYLAAEDFALIDLQ